MPRTLAPLIPAASLLLGLALFLNTLAALLAPSLNSTLWLIDLRPLPIALQALLTLAWSAALLARAFRPPTALLRTAILFFALAAAINTAAYYLLLIRGSIHTARPIPLSLALAVVLALLAFRRETFTTLRPTLLFAPALAALGLLLQILFFGSTDYRRPADAIVVFGARVYADGSPSLAAADRVATAVSLYKQGLAPTIIMSGGPGDGPLSEPQSMKALAIRQGVPPSAILTDERGFNTLATIRNTSTALAPGARILAVSHAYHLARIKLTSDRAGLNAYTVPAAESRPLLGKPYFLAREVAALADYYISK
ncbi:MAG: hypothetical protein GC200_00385 [Tepidisphaera sp.]|nr:hypothetical protein [Tepidisphaera sp.]